MNKKNKKFNLKVNGNKVEIHSDIDTNELFITIGTIIVKNIVSDLTKEIVIDGIGIYTKSVAIIKKISDDIVDMIEKVEDIKNVEYNIIIDDKGVATITKNNEDKLSIKDLTEIIALVITGLSKGDKDKAVELIKGFIVPSTEILSLIFFGKIDKDTKHNKEG